MRLVAVPVFVSLLACAGLVVEPEEGEYAATVHSVELSDGCDDWDLHDYQFEAIDAVDVAIEDDAVTFDDALDCERRGVAFDCDEEDEQGSDGITFSYATVGEGRWTADTTFTSTWALTYVCAGDCGALEACEVTYTLDGARD